MEFQNYQKFQSQNIFINKMLFAPYQRPIRGTRTQKLQQVGNYQYNKKDILGQGFSSKVYKGTDKNNQEQVAIKVFNTEVLSEQIHVTLLESQLRILQNLKGSDHILEIHTIIKEGKDTYIITEICKTDLAKLLTPLLPIETVQKYIHELLQGFRQLFRREIIHRDLKPANLLIDIEGNLKIADFGFAIKSSEARLQTKFNIGSPLYMSPQALKRNQYSYKSDIWAIGIIIFQMLTGDTPWKADNEDQLYEKLDKQRIQSILLNYTFPQSFNNLLIKTLQFDRKKRISAEQLILLQVCSKQNKQLAEAVEQKEIKLQKQIFVPRAVKTTKTQKFYKPLATTAANFSKATDHAVEQPSKISIKPVTRPNRNINKRVQQNATHLNIESTVVENKQTTASNAKTNQSNTVTAIQDKIDQPTKLTKDQIKAITKNLIYYVHSVRLFYKVLLRFDEILQINFNEIVIDKLKSIRSQFFSQYCKVIVLYIYKIKNFTSNNFLGLPKHHHEEYITSNDYKKLRKVCGDYIQKYSKSEELKYLWVQRQQPNLANCITQTIAAIQKLWPELCQKNHNQIILLQFLIVSHEVLSALEKGSYNFVVNKDKIQDYVDTIPNPPSFNRFKQSIANAKQICQILKS